MSQLIDIVPIQKLDLIEASQAGRPTFVSAASGLVQYQSHFYVVPDDELSLAIFEMGSQKPGHLYPLFEGQLPLEKKPRKKQKPDLEALCLFSDASAQSPTLIAFPSGSKANRTQGAQIFLDPRGQPARHLQLDFSDLYQNLPFQKLNIEGTLVIQNELWLFQRGNSEHLENAIVKLDLTTFTRQLNQDQKVTKDCFKSTHSFNLGKLNGLDLSFTDACPFEENQILFLASTEDTDNPYDDGEFKGAVLGAMNFDLKIQWTLELPLNQKPEGIFWAPQIDKEAVWIVTDSDDSSEPALLYKGNLK